MKTSLVKQSKRGDTIIEVMFGFAIFTLIAIITITMMNLGLAASERSLELVTARNELNAQAEALRFIHSSYIAELTLPTLDDLISSGIPESEARKKQYQQYAELWGDLTDPGKLLRACTQDEIDGGASDCYDSAAYQFTGEYGCREVYADNNEILERDHAFVLNARRLLSHINNFEDYSNNDALIRANRNNTNIFVSPTLNARILYGPETRDEFSGEDLGESSDDRISSLSEYTRIAKVEGIWVVGVKGPTTKFGATDVPQYYDFYINTCWYGSGNAVPTALDAVVRLYNPEGV